MMLLTKNSSKIIDLIRRLKITHLLTMRPALPILLIGCTTINRLLLMNMQIRISATRRILIKMTQSLLIIITMIIVGTTGIGGTAHDGMSGLDGIDGEEVFGMSRMAGEVGMTPFMILSGVLAGDGTTGDGTLVGGIRGPGMAGAGEVVSMGTHGVHPMEASITDLCMS